MNIMKYIVMYLFVGIASSSKNTNDPHEEDYRLLQKFGMLQNTEWKEENVLNPNYLSNQSMLKKFTEKANEYGKFGKEQAEKALKKAGTNVKEMTTDLMGQNTKSNLETAKSYMKWGFCLCKYDNDEGRLAQAAMHAKEILKLDHLEIAKFFAYKGDETKNFCEFAGAYQKRRDSELKAAEQKKEELRNLIGVLNDGITYMYVKLCTRIKLLAEERPDFLDQNPDIERFSKQHTEHIADILDAIQRVVNAAGNEVPPLEKWQVEKEYRKLKSKAMIAAEYYSKPLQVVIHSYEVQAENVMQKYLLKRQNLDDLTGSLYQTFCLVQEIKRISAPKAEGFFKCCNKSKKTENFVAQDIVKRSDNQPSVLFAFEEDDDNIIINYDRSHMIGYNTELCGQSHGNIIDDSIFGYDYSMN